MSNKPKPGSYIDTQGMSGPIDPHYKGKKIPSSTKPMEVRPRRVHTDTMVKELKILINEVLDEREGKRDYISYFDTEHFKYRVGGEEPPYKQ